MTTKIKNKFKIENIRYYNDEKAWGVIVVSSSEDFPFAKVKEEYDVNTNTINFLYTTVIKGKMPKPEKGMIWNIEAKHVYEVKYKDDQYEVENIYISKPSNFDESQKYLESILTKNQTETLLNTYPNIVNEIIKGEDNVDLSLLKGFGQYTWDNVKEKIVENFAISDVLTLLIPLGISFKKIQKLLDDEKNPQILKERIIKNPYKLTEINGITFKTADKIATQLNPSLQESEERLIAFIQYSLDEIGNSDGHIWIYNNILKSMVLGEIPECEKFYDSFMEKEKTNHKVLYIDGDKIGLFSMYVMEKYIYNALNNIHNSEVLPVTDENIENGIRRSEEDQEFSYSIEQKNILIEMTKNNFSILSGFGGSGKSSLSRGLLNIYADAKYKIAVCALSAQAAKRASETTGYFGTTIHSLLLADYKGFGKGETSKLEYDVILVDEQSMTNSYINYSFLKAINTSKTKLIMVGDHFQLPPIGSGQLFTDLLTTENKFQKNILTTIFRQSENSGIFIDAMKMRLGENPLSDEEMNQSKVVHGNNDMIYVFSDDKEYLHNIAISSYKKAVEQDGLENVVLLTPRKTTVLNCTQQFNKELQEELNTENLNNKYEYGKKRILLKDRIIQIVNDKEKEIYNGYFGEVIEIHDDGITSLFEDQIIADHLKEEINDIELGYSISCHRSQGSEYQTVIVVLDMASYMLLFSQMLYTAQTRGKRRVLICAQPQAYKMCLRESKNNRQTWIKEFLENENQNISN